MERNGPRRPGKGRDQELKIERFQYFVEVASAKSITAAARRCYISQTALCQQMDALEQELGVRLLERTKTGTSLTAAGERLLPRAQALLRDYQEISRLFDREKERENKLVVAYAGPIEQQLLLSAIPEFHRLCAEADIQIRQRPLPAMGRELESGECDLALSLPGEVGAKGFHHATIMEKPICVALSVRSPLAEKPFLRLEELRDSRMILLRSDACVHASGQIQQWLLAGGWQPARFLYADTIENQLLMVNLDQGLTLVPEGRYPQGIRLLPLIGDEPLIHRTEAVYTDHSPLVSTMVRLLRQAAPTL